MASNSPTDSPAAQRSIRARRVAAICLFVTVCALTTIPAIFIVEKYLGRAAWRAYETEARQRGVKLDFADYIPPQVPAAENFAAIPIFEAVFAADEAGQKASNPFALPDAKDGRKAPKFADPIKQERLDLEVWQKFFVEAGVLSSAGESAARDVLRALEKYDEPLAQLRVGSERPHSRFPVRYEKGFAASLPHLTLLRDAGKLHALRIPAHLALGESAAAYEDFQAGMRVVTATAKEPTLIAGLIRLAVCGALENAVWDGLAGRQWAEPELRRIEADLAALDWLEDYLFAMGSERGGFNFMADMLIQRPGMMVDLARDVQSPGSSGNWAFWLYPTGWHYRSKVRANRFFDETAARIDPKQRRFFADRAVPSSPANLTDMSAKIRLMLFALAAPVFETVEKRYLQAATVTAQTRIACALERHRLARGNYPENLTALTPEFLTSVPSEIVNGEPCRYRLSEGGVFELYSVGADLRDDGGGIDPQLSATKQKDWVWRYPAR